MEEKHRDYSIKGMVEEGKVMSVSPDKIT